ARELAEIGGDVEWTGKTAMHAAEPARPHEANPHGAADCKRAADGRRADSSLGHAGSKIARAGLARALVELPELFPREADADLPVEHADRRRHRAGRANPALGLEPHRQAVTRRKPVRDERRLERDHGIRLPHLVGDDDHGIAPGCATQRAAASSASSRPPTTNPAAKASPAPVASTTSPSRAGNSTRSSPSTSRPRAPRFTTAVGASPYAPPTISPSASFAKITSGSSCSSWARKRTAPCSRMRVHAERSTLTR